MSGMTLKEYHRYRFFQLIDAMHALDLGTDEGKHSFVVLSVQLHIAKGQVPKRLWPLANRKQAEKAS